MNRAAAALPVALVAPLVPAVAVVIGVLVVVAAALMPGEVQAQEPSAESSIDWTLAERDNISLWHYQGELRAEVLADNGQGAYDLVSDLIDASFESSLTIIVWPEGSDPADGAQLPEGVEADGFLQHVTRNSSADVRNAVTNSLITAATGAHAGEVPIWMRAALGFWSQGPLPGFYLRRAGSVVILDHEEYYTLEQLETVPVTWQFQAKYFGQAGGMLSWMIQDWGPEALAELFRLTRSGVLFYDAIEQVYEIDADQFIAEFTKNAERALLLTWPYIEQQTPPLWERLDVNVIIIIAAAIPMFTLFFFIGKRLFYD